MQSETDSIDSRGCAMLRPRKLLSANAQCCWSRGLTAVIRHIVSGCSAVASKIRVLLSAAIDDPIESSRLHTAELSILHVSCADAASSGIELA